MNNKKRGNLKIYYFRKEDSTIEDTEVNLILLSLSQFANSFSQTNMAIESLS